MGAVHSAHAAQDAEEALGGATLPVPGLPQVENCLGGAGPAGEEGRVAVDVEPLGE